MFFRVFLMLVLLCCNAFAGPGPDPGTGAGAGAGAPSVAFFYGPTLPQPEARAFDYVVVEAAHGHDPKTYRTAGSELFAYVAVGEVEPSRDYLKDIPAQWLFASNEDWNAKVLDLSVPQWADFLADRVVAPLWQKGYRGLFLDTLDSYRLAKKFDEAAQQDGLVRVIETLHKRFPGIKLILNRGFEVLPRVSGKVNMVAAESLYGRWVPRDQRYAEVPAADRDWLKGQLLKVRDEYRIPAVAIDYAPPEDRAKTRAIAEKIKQDGLIPWVADGALYSLGVGAVESFPRRVLVLYNSTEQVILNYTQAHRFFQMPLNHMGYIVDYIDVTSELPKGVLNDRYAGIVLLAPVVPNSRKLTNWLVAKKNEGMRLAIINSLPLELDKTLGQQLGIKASPARPSGRVTIAYRDPMIGFEYEPVFSPRDLDAIEVTDTELRPIIVLEDEKKRRFTGGALTSWGGIILNPFVTFSVPKGDQELNFWIVDPFAFISKALRLPDFPAPDTTTENGRRLLLSHIDGDGFPNIGEFPGAPLASEVLLKEVLERYRIPVAMSVIESEVSAQGVFPKLSARMETAARKMFALDHVEIASHSYSHPFLWDLDKKHSIFLQGNTTYNIDIPGYKRSNEREIQGSIDYIQKNLAPRGKKVKLMLWTGDTAPSPEALEMTVKAGVLNLNGGDTSITKSRPSLTGVGSNGIIKNGVLQVYAPVTNENIYTNLWLGPFYGFEKVIETFEMTDTPRRIKPVGIYYHTYSASKPAALNALHKVYGWALSRPLNHIYPTEFARKVQDFYGVSIARSGERWYVSGEGNLRTVRLPRSAGVPDMKTANNVAGFSTRGDEIYVHLADGRADFSLVPAGKAVSLTYVHDANGRITDWRSSQQGKEFAFTLAAYQKPEFRLANAGSCKVTVNGRALQASKREDAAGLALHVYQMNDRSGSVHVGCAAQ